MTTKPDNDDITEEIRLLLDQHLGEWELTLLRGDASTRRYARVHTREDRRFIVTEYPADLRPQLERFLACQRGLADHANVPALVAVADGGVLQQDVGDTTLVSILREDPERGRELYREAVDQIVRIQSCPAAILPNPPFDVTLFTTELNMTLDFYVDRLAGCPGSVGELRETFETLAAGLTRHPYVICHRDYHGENLHVHQESLWIIDFQDMRLGPDTYDLASLLRDRGIIRLLGKEAEADLLRYYARRIGAGSEIELRYWETLLQRTIKIIGTFARQSVERGRHHYLDYIPSALDTIRDCVDHLPVYRAMTDLFPTHYERPRGESA